MYQPSQRFLEHIDNSLNFAPKAKIVVDGVEYTGESHLKTWPRIEHCAEKFIGGFPAKTCSFEIWNRDGSIDLHGKEVAVYRGFKLSNNDIDAYARSNHIHYITVEGDINTDIYFLVTVICDSTMDTVYMYNPAVPDYPFGGNNSYDTLPDGTRRFQFGMSINTINNTIFVDSEDVGAWPEIKVFSSTEWIPMGLFTAAPEDITTSKTGSFITFNGADRSKAFEKSYGGELEYPVALGAFMQDICDRAGIPLETPDFPLSDMLLPDKPNMPNDYPERELIARAAELGGCIAQVSREGGLRITRAEDTGRTIPQLHYKSLEVEPPYTPINSVSLGHADYEDAVFLEDEDAIAADGKSEWLLPDNPFVDLHREYFIPRVAAELYGMTIIPFKATKLLDFLIHDINDLVTITAKDGSTIQTAVLQIKNTARIRSEIATPTQTGGKTNKAMAGGLRAAMRSVKLTVDHQNAIITALAEEVNGHGDEFNSIVEQTANEIMQSVAAQYATGDYLESVMRQMSDGIDFRFFSAQDQVDALTNEISGNQSLLEEYIRFQGALIELGKVGNAFTAQLDNGRLAFLEDGNPIAYISNQKLWITDAQVLNQLRIGKWIWTAQSDDSLILAWVGSS